MAQQCVVGVYPSIELAREAVLALERAQYPAEQVSLVTHNVKREVPRVGELQYGDQGEQNAARGTQAPLDCVGCHH